MKKLAALVCGILCVCLLSVPVYASGDPAITITDDGIGGDEVIVAGTEPVSVTAETVEGVPYITKVYELPQGADTSGLTASFEQDGHLYTKHDVSQQVQQGQTETKAVTQIETLESESGKVVDIVAEAAPVLVYSEDGYTGQLALDVAAIVVEENGSSTYSYRVEDVREYTNLDRNDAAYVPKTVLKNGVTLQLENIEWVVMGQHPVDGRMVPNLFKAIATYAGTATGSRASGYTATLTYTGEVTKTTPGSIVYTVIFRGEPQAIAESTPDTSEPEAAAKKGGGVGYVIMLAVVILLSAACLAVAGVRIYRYIQDRRGDGDDDGFTGGDFSGYEGYGEPDAEQPISEDTQPSRQTYPQDDFNIDDLFSEEGIFSE